MKNLIVIIFVFFFLSNIQAQTCLPDGIVFTNQAQVDSFSILYPDCNEIIGSVKIEGTNIKHVDSLYSITKIGGDLLIRDNSLLGSIFGLQELTTISGSLGFYYCDKISSLAMFSNLSNIGVDLIISLKNITDFQGLEGITKISNNLRLRGDCINLVSLNGLNNMTYVGNEFRIDCELHDLKGLESLTTIGRRLHLDGPLKSLEGLEHLDALEELIVSGEPSLKTIDGLGGLTSISLVYITGNDSLVSITGLSSLTEIGSLLLLNNPNLESLKGLENVESMDVFSVWLTGMVDFHEMSNLKSVKTQIRIAQNDQLKSLFGLHNIQDLNSLPEFSLSTNPNQGFAAYLNPKLSYGHLPNICSFLEEVDVVSLGSNAPGCNSKEEILDLCLDTTCPFGDLVFYSQSEVDSFPITHPNCEAIYGSIIIHDTNINSLDSLIQIERIYGDLSIHRNPLLTSLSGLDSVHVLTGDMGLVDNKSMTSLTSFHNLHRIEGGLRVDQMDGLLDLEGLSSLHYLEGSLEINSNNQLVSLYGLGQLKTIGGVLSINFNPKLISIEGLERLNHVHYNRTYVSTIGIRSSISNNYSLLDIAGLSDVSMMTELYIVNNTSLNELVGLEHLSTITDGHLIIAGNDNLRSLGALSHLTHISGNLQIEDNDQLENMEGLLSLTTLDGSMIIRDNAKLISLTGLDSINPLLLNRFDVRGNEQLSYCSIASICEKLKLNNSQDSIVLNTTGCNTIEEVNNICINSIEGIDRPSDLYVYPNPTNGKLSFSNSNTLNRIVSVQVFNSLGEVMLSFSNMIDEIDVSSLMSGIYYLQMNTENGERVITKIVKQ